MVEEAGKEAERRGVDGEKTVKDTNLVRLNKINFMKIAVGKMHRLYHITFN